MIGRRPCVLAESDARKQRRNRCVRGAICANGERHTAAVWRFLVNLSCVMCCPKGPLRSRLLRASGANLGALGDRCLVAGGAKVARRSVGVTGQSASFCRVRTQTGPLPSGCAICRPRGRLAEFSSLSVVCRGFTRGWRPATNAAAKGVVHAEVSSLRARVCDHALVRVFGYGRRQRRPRPSSRPGSGNHEPSDNFAAARASLVARWGILGDLRGERPGGVAAAASHPGRVFEHRP